MNREFAAQGPQALGGRLKPGNTPRPPARTAVPYLSQPGAARCPGEVAAAKRGRVRDAATWNRAASCSQPRSAAHLPAHRALPPLSYSPRPFPASSAEGGGAVRPTPGLGAPPSPFPARLAWAVSAASSSQICREGEGKRRSATRPSPPLPSPFLAVLSAIRPGRPSRDSPSSREEGAVRANQPGCGPLAPDPTGGPHHPRASFREPRPHP